LLGKWETTKLTQGGNGARKNEQEQAQGGEFWEKCRRHIHECHWSGGGGGGVGEEGEKMNWGGGRELNMDGRR